MGAITVSVDKMDLKTSRGSSPSAPSEVAESSSSAWSPPDPCVELGEWPPIPCVEIGDGSGGLVGVHDMGTVAGLSNVGSRSGWKLLDMVVSPEPGLLGMLVSLDPSAVISTVPDMLAQSTEVMKERRVGELKLPMCKCHLPILSSSVGLMSRNNSKFQIRSHIPGLHVHT